MDIKTMCHMCGKIASRICSMCGRPACDEHISNGVCKSCLGGKKAKSYKN